MAGTTLYFSLTVSSIFLLLCLPSGLALTELTAEERLMEWQEAENSNALCNDFSRAGFFIRRNATSDKWIVFLEGGTLCFSNGTCNRRFFRSEVSKYLALATAGLT